MRGRLPRRFQSLRVGSRKNQECVFLGWEAVASAGQK